MAQPNEKPNGKFPEIRIINTKDIPRTGSGEPDVVAILAANGLSDVDMSKVTVVQAGDSKAKPGGENQDIRIIQSNDVPMNEAGEPDIAAILAANGLSDIDMSQVKVVHANA